MRDDEGMNSVPSVAAPGALPQTRSHALAQRLSHLVPGGAHTYAKGGDQYPADLAPIIAAGQGCRVRDVDGNTYVEYGSGLRSIVLGHAHPAVLDAVRDQLPDGSNFARPSALEVEAAEDFLAAVPTVDMVKFAKNGSDVTTAAVRLARAVTGRDAVAICADHPFFSTDDWFISGTPMPAGIPQRVQQLNRTFAYGDLGSLERALADGTVAAVVLEPETASPAPAGYLAAVHELAHRHGALVVLDEMISGLRTALGGAHAAHGIRPDLVTFGKALGNGFAVSALGGRRDLMERGGFPTEADRVFLLSTTHGAEGHALAAMRATLAEHRRTDLSRRLHDIGTRLIAALQPVIDAAGVRDHVVLRGQPQNLVFGTLGPDGAPSQAYRTLFMRALLEHGVLAPSFVVSGAVDDAAVETTADAVAVACRRYAEALDAGDPTPWMGGRPVQPVFRPRG